MTTENIENLEEVKKAYYQVKTSTVEHMKDLLHEIKWSKHEELKAKIIELETELENLKNTKKYWLVWDSEKEPEQVVLDCQNKLPILKEEKSRKILNDNSWESNLLIEWDNYHSLQVLNYTHKEAIDIIYIDPPYNTWWEDFIYNDKIIDENDTYRHSKWLNFMDKRIDLAKRLLKEDGLLVISIDDNEMPQLKLLLDEYFQDKVKIVVVKMSEASWLKMGAVKKAWIIPKYKEYILFAKLWWVKNMYFDYIKKDKWDNEYNLFIENFTKEDKKYIDTISNSDFISNNDISKIDLILSKISIVSVSKKIKDLSIEQKKELEWKYNNAWRIARTAASSSVKKLVDIKKEKLNQRFFSIISVRDKILYIWKSDYSKESKQPRVQLIFAEDNLMVHPWDLWLDIKTTWLEAEWWVKFKNGKKPLSLIKKIIKTKSKDSLVLDFFAWSWTTWHAVLDLNKEDNGNRRFILCTNNEWKICEGKTYKRLTNVLNSNKNWNLRYYKTDFVEIENLKEITDQKKLELTYNAWELLAIKEWIYNELEKNEYWQIFESNKDIVAVYFKESSRRIDDMKNRLIEIQKQKWWKVKWYIYNNPYEKTMFKGIKKLELKDIPDPILKVYREINKV